MELRAGELTIDGGKFIAHGKPASATPNGNGSTIFGAAVAISQHTTKLPIKVEINGGTFEGHTPFYQANPQNNPQEALDKIELRINGGTFTPTNGGTKAVYSQNFKGFIVGGTFNDATHSAEYWAIAKVGDKFYGDLQKAVDAANDGDTIVLTKDINLNTAISLSKNLTIDLNGKTITNNVPQWMMTVSSPVKLTLKGGKVITPTANTDFW